MVRELQDYLKKVTRKEWFLDKTADQKFGDYSSNVALKLAREQGKPPYEIAKELALEISRKDTEKVFERVEAAPPGFVNFWVVREFLIGRLSKIVSPASRVRNDGGGAGIAGKGKINLEFISANPTGPLTMANGRGGFLGNVLSNVLENAGYKVVCEYYINDAGVQIKKLGASALATLGLIEPSEEHYRGAYVAELAEKYKTKILKLYKGEIATLKTPRPPAGDLPKGDNDGIEEGKMTEEIGRLLAKDLLAQIKKSVKAAGINFDKWFSENNGLRKKGALQKTLEVLRSRGMVYEKDGATWLKTQSGESEKLNATSNTKEREGEDDKDRVLIKSDGEPTYFLSDLAYHYDKLVLREFDKAFVIWGADHHGYVPRLKAGMAALGIDPARFDAIIVQLVRLVRGGEEVRMSKRKGEFITLNDLIKDVGRDAARFFFLMYSPDTHMDFDLDLAKEKSLKNPVYYVQYAAVRCGGILRKSNVKYQKSRIKFDLLSTNEDLNLIRQLARFSEVIKEAANNYNPQILARYSLDLAKTFHNFYEKERIMGAEENLMAARLELIKATQVIFKNLFGLLGVSMPKKM